MVCCLDGLVGPECLLQEPCRTAATAQFMPHGVIRTEILVAVQPRNIMETIHQIRRKREQLFHRQQFLVMQK